MVMGAGIILVGLMGVSISPLWCVIIGGLLFSNAAVDLFLENIRRQTALLAAMDPRDGWHKIDSAPGPEIIIDLWVPHEGRTAECWWTGQRWVTYSLYDGLTTVDGATHWRHIPGEPLPDKDSAANNYKGVAADVPGATGPGGIDFWAIENRKD